MYDGHSPTPGAPLSPITLNSTQSHWQANRHDMMMTSKVHAAVNYGGGYQEVGVRSHARSHSQPDNVLNVVSHSPLAPHSSSQPHANAQSPPPKQTSRHQHQHHHHHQHKKDRNSKNGHHRSKEQSVFKSSYPGHKSHRNGTKSHRGSGSNGGQPLQPHMLARVIDNQQPSSRGLSCSNEGSQEGASGRVTPADSTPTLASRQLWSNGNDSGFDSMNRDTKSPAHLAASAAAAAISADHYSHSGCCVSDCIVMT